MIHSQHRPTHSHSHTPSLARQTSTTLPQQHDHTSSPLPPFLHPASELSKEDPDDPIALAHAAALTARQKQQEYNDVYGAMTSNASSSHRSASSTAAAAADDDRISPVSRLRGLGPGARRRRLLADNEELGITAVVATNEHETALDYDALAKSYRRDEEDSHTATITSTTSTQQLAPTPKANSTATRFHISFDENKSLMVKTRLKACGLTEEMIDLMRPTISPDQVASMWSHFDLTHASTLNAAECRQMAVWLYGRIPVLFRTMAKRANPSKTKQELNALVQEHLTYILPGTTDDICGYFVSTLPFSSSSSSAAPPPPATGAVRDRISRDEFIHCWNHHARLIFPSSHHRTSERGTIYCTIL